MIAARTMTRSALRTRMVILWGLLAVVVGITGCGGSQSAPGAVSSPSLSGAATPTARPSTSAANSTTIAAIKTSYLEFFNPATSLPEAMTVLQDGPAFKATLMRQAQSSFAKATTVTVSTVTLDSPNKATVVYTILLSGAPVLVDTTGLSIREGGRWKVAGATFCGLLAAQGPRPPICAQATATSAPN